MQVKLDVHATNVGTLRIEKIRKSWTHPFSHCVDAVLQLPNQAPRHLTLSVGPNWGALDELDMKERIAV